MERLKRNRDRRLARDKAKVVQPGSVDGEATPDAEANGEVPAAVATAKSSGTQRKCANCGQVGHIKTNKKSVILTSPP